ncbi:hypothetical protein GCM10027567_05260 [Spongiibacter taiwanensis]
MIVIIVHTQPRQQAGHRVRLARDENGGKLQETTRQRHKPALETTRSRFAIP